jgi:hypothetical protein
LSGDRWVFPLPGEGRNQAVQTAAPRLQPGAAAEPEREPSGSPAGWAIVDRQFLSERSTEETRERLLQFYDGRPPTWRLALSAFVPIRAAVERLRGRFRGLEGSNKPTIVNLLGAGGEGKSTVFLQAIIGLILEEDWVALWRHNDLESIDWKQIRRVAHKYNKLLVAIDEAHSIAPLLADIIKRLGSDVSVHFLLCSRSLDWRAEVREMSSITIGSNYQELTLRGIDRPDAELIVKAWGELGQEGLGALALVQPEFAVESLIDAARNQEAEDDEGALFGAMLKLRYGERLKDRLRSILYKLSEMQTAARPLLDAYTMIVAMHAEGLRFLSLPVLAERFNMSQSDFQRVVIAALADEAVAAGGGRFVLCRHKQIAIASLQLLREMNLFGDVDACYSDLSQAAILARAKGVFVPELHDWDYELPDHFLKARKQLIAVSAAEKMQSADYDDIHLRVNLSDIYRTTNQSQKSSNLFRDYLGEMTRAAWHEWSVSERGCNEMPNSLVLALISICDLPYVAAPARNSILISCNSMTQTLLLLYGRYRNQGYLTAIGATVRISQILCDNDEEWLRTTEEISASARQVGSVVVADQDLLPTLDVLVQSVLPLVDFDQLAKGRVPRECLNKLEGVSAVIRRLLVAAP